MLPWWGQPSLGQGERGNDGILVVGLFRHNLIFDLLVGGSWKDLLLHEHIVPTVRIYRSTSQASDFEHESRAENLLYHPARGDL